MAEDYVSDGFGSEWPLCDRVNCGLQVVRPGKVQCWCDTDKGPFWLARPEVASDDSGASGESDTPVDNTKGDDRG